MQRIIDTTGMNNEQRLRHYHKRRTAWYWGKMNHLNSREYNFAILKEMARWEKDFIDYFATLKSLEEVIA